MSAITVKTLLRTSSFRPGDMDAVLDPDQASYVRFDTEMGYVPNGVILKDGMDHSHCTYTYEPPGQRKMVNYPESLCRINTYGDSFTQCQQVSDDETWQERLAAHFQEPIRNFGCGGYGVYQAYHRAQIMEATDLAAEYIILNIYDDDHVRNVDACRWIRSAWNMRDWPRERAWPLHGLPWPHVRFDLQKNHFVELGALCKSQEELRALASPESFYEAFKDDTIAHLFTLQIGGETPVDELEALAEALAVEVNLRDAEKRRQDALKLQVAYGFKASEYTLDQMRSWAQQNGKKLIILLSYSGERIREFVEAGRRFDQPIVDYLEKNDVLYVDGLLKAAEDFKAYNLSCREYLDRFYINPAGAAVCGHYNPAGNHFFAFSIREEIVDWLDPKPPAYKDKR